MARYRDALHKKIRFTDFTKIFNKNKNIGNRTYSMKVIRAGGAKKRKIKLFLNEINNIC